MSDKQIIIDCVDVSCCKYFFLNADNVVCCDLSSSGGCRGIDCYYKQLKLKEQESKIFENYKSENELLFKIIEILINKIYSYKDIFRK